MIEKIHNLYGQIVGILFKVDDFVLT